MSEQPGTSRTRDRRGPGGRRRESFRDFRSRMSLQARPISDSEAAIYDVYEKVSSSISQVRSDTGLVYDEANTLHRNEYDDKHPENPQRYTAILKRFTELNLVDRCKRIEIRKADEEDICLIHFPEHFANLKLISELNDIKAYERYAEQYDSIYFNQGTFEAARIAAGGVITLCEEICRGNIQNGMAIVRPPGHHAMESEYNGYCFFNNVAIAAKSMLEKQLASKILIVDFDVHHGQATQKTFYDTNQVLYFSIHRYQHGQFWPNLRESNFDFVGRENGVGYNINVPLNEINCMDRDYLAIVLHILLPVAYEYQPDLIIVSAGYDSCIGCPEGEMRVTPGFYGHMIKLLGGLAKGRIAVCLEGGYFLPSLAEGAALTLKALLDDPVASLKDLSIPLGSVVKVINSLKYTLRPYWSCFRAVNTVDEIKLYHTISLKYKGVMQSAPYPTRDAYPIRNAKEIETYTAAIDNLKLEYESLCTKPVGYTFDEELLRHYSENHQLEVPQRLMMILQKFEEFRLNERCKYIPGQYASLMATKKIHSSAYVESLMHNIGILVENKDDLYANKNTPKCVLKAVGCLLNLVDHVMKGDITSGAAFIRPPGHHADYDQASGFCFMNNVSIAAAHLLSTYNLKKILIVDFDIHHGNGTQNSFYQTPEVLYISIHRYDDAKFYPNSTHANLDNIGIVRGAGYNINIPFNDDNMGNVEYITAFLRVILPVAYEYNPEIVLVSAGFDAGVNDPLGHYNLTPEIFGHFIQLLKPLAGGRMILTLEGGYNKTTLAYSMISCIKTLLGDPLPQLDEFSPIIKSAADSINNVVGKQKMYWQTLRVDKMLPDNNAVSKLVVKFAI